jgi:thymidylate synthase
MKQYLDLLRRIMREGAVLADRTGVGTVGDVHLYRNHVQQAHLQLSRTPHRLPTLQITVDPAQVQELENFRVEHLALVGYHPHPTIKAQVAV